MSEVLSINPENRHNAELIQDCVTLGFLNKDQIILDATYGFGNFWSLWTPDFLVGIDLHSEKAVSAQASFTELPFANETFDVTVLDPPYRLNGTGGTHVADMRYGTAEPNWDGLTWQEKHELIKSGISDTARVTKNHGLLLLKCQDQVCSGKKRFQTHEFTRFAEDECGLVLAEELRLLGYRKQPPGRRQLHARSNSSSLLIFRKSS